MTFADKNYPKKPLYFCEKCDFISNNKKDYTRHMATLKHINDDVVDIKNPPKPLTYICECSKEYASRQGMYSHKKKCNFLKEENLEEQELVKYLMKENSELKNMILDVSKNMQPSTNIAKHVVIDK